VTPGNLLDWELFDGHSPVGRLVYGVRFGFYTLAPSDP
jgi:hypothetical protein